MGFVGKGTKGLGQKKIKTVQGPGEAPQPGEAQEGSVDETIRVAIALRVAEPAPERPRPFA